MRERVGDLCRVTVGKMQPAACLPPFVHPLFPHQRADHLACAVFDRFDRLDRAPVFLGQRFHLLGSHAQAERPRHGRLVLPARQQPHHAFPVGGRRAVRLCLRHNDGVAVPTGAVHKNVRLLPTGQSPQNGAHSLYHGNIRRRQAGIFPAECLDRIHHTQRPPLLIRMISATRRMDSFLLWLSLRM